MKKHLFRAVAITCALSTLCASALVSCGGEASAPAVTTASAPSGAESESTTAAPQTDGLEKRDMDGFTLNILHHNSEFMTWTVTQLDAETMNGELLNDAIYTRNEAVMERFNCDIAVAGERSITSDIVSKSVMAGETTYDIFMQRDYYISKSAQYLLSFDSLPYIALDSDWWYPEATDAFRFGGKLLAAANSASLSCVSRASGFCFNKAVYDELSMKKSLYDYVYDDEWTLENFATIARSAAKDLDGDSDMDDKDRYGIGPSSWKEIFARLINGSGVFLVSSDKDGYPVFTLDGDKTGVTKLLKIFELFSDKSIYTNKDSNMDAAAAYGDILKGTALFRLCHARTMEMSLRYADVDVGVVPNPKYDEKQDRYYSTTWAFEIMTLPLTLSEKRFENIGILLEALSFASHHDILGVYKEDIVKTKLSHDIDSLAMFDIIFDSMVFDLGLVLWETDIGNPLIKEIYATGDGNVASSLAAQKGVVDGVIGDFIESLGEKAK